MLAKIPQQPSTGARKFDCIQSQFKRNTANCRFASSLASEANNVTKKPITLEYMRDVEARAYSQFVMPKWPLTTVGGIRMISELSGRGKDLFPFGGFKFNQYLDKWYVIVVGIRITETFISQRFSGGMIVWWKGNITWWHSICLFKENGKYYFLNSRGGNPIREIQSLDIYNVFDKAASCWVILP